MPMMPMLDAKLVRKVRPFFVRRLLNESESAVKKLILVFFREKPSGRSTASQGLLSAVMRPSAKRMMRSAYFSASAGLCVTMMTSRLAESDLISSIICTLVSESSAPVGSSQSRISGSLASARAMATRCICPPESWLGFLCRCSFSPTCSSTSMARLCFSSRETPESVIPSSTLVTMDRCEMRL